MENGLRQRGPLSPFLLLIVAEGLSALMKEAVNKDLFQGFFIGRNNIKVTHLQFAYDTLIVGSGESNNIFTLKAMLLYFELVSGLRTNFYKS